METTWTFSVRLPDGKLADKSVTFKTAVDISVENLKKQLEVPLTKEYTLSCLKADNTWQIIEQEKDLDAIRNGSNLKITRRLPSVDERLDKADRDVISQKMSKLSKQASDLTLKKPLLEAQYKKNFKGGSIKYKEENAVEEEWTYDADGTLTNPKEIVDGKPIVYNWDGMTLYPANKSYGAGLWDGQTFTWFQKEWEVYKTGARRSTVLSLKCDEKKKKFVKETTAVLGPSLQQLSHPVQLSNEFPSSWEFDTRTLKAEGSKDQHWTTEGEVPVPLLMALAILRYLRSPVKHSSFSSTSGSSSRGSGSLSSNSSEEQVEDFNAVISTMDVPLSSPAATLAYEGEVLMKVGDSKGWKKKYCVLRSNDKLLYYYKSKELMASTKPKSLMLLKCTLSVTMKKDKYCVILKKEEGSKLQIYQILVDTRAQRETWVALLLGHGASKAGVKKEGYLRSRAKYWFVLQRRFLIYYEKQEDAMYDRVPKGTIDLYHCSLLSDEGSSKKKLGFAIQSSKGKKYTLFTESLHEYNEWVQLISESIEDCRLIKASMSDMNRTKGWEQEEEDLDVMDYPFDEADSDENITYADPKELDSSDEPSPDDPPLIKGATLTKLVEKLTSSDRLDMNYISDFLLTFRSFTTTNELLTLLIKRFNIPSPKTATEEEHAQFERTRNIVRLRVFNFIKLWVDSNPKDFEDQELTKNLLVFAKERMIKVLPEQAVNGLVNKLTGPKEVVVQFEPKNYPPPILPEIAANKHSSDALGFFDYDSEEMARQIALIDFSLYKAIKPWEFFNKGWTKESSAPNLFALINRFNEMSKWIATEIVLQENLRNRAKVLCKWIEIADKCKSLNNFSAVMSIISALQSAGIFRLKQTWALVPPNTRELFEDVKRVMAREGNFRNFRKHFRECPPPKIPYIGVHLTDLTFIDDGNKDFLEGGLIHFGKRRRLATVLRDIIQNQMTPYNFQEVLFIKEFILNGVGLEEPEVYNLSINLEAKTGGTIQGKPTDPGTISKIVELREKRRSTSNRRSTSQSSRDSTSGNSKEDAASRRLQKMKELNGKFYNAVRDGNVEKVKSLLSQGIVLKGNVEAHLQTPLHIAAYEGHYDLVVYLLEPQDSDIGNPDINARDNSGWTALHCAASPGHLEICELLLKHKADPNIGNMDKNLPLHYLSRRIVDSTPKKTSSKPRASDVDSVYVRVMKYMAECGVNVNMANINGDTPLHQAASSGNEEAVRLLLKMKANPALKNRNDETPYMCAQRANHAAVIDLLKDLESPKGATERKALMSHENIHLDDIYSIVKLIKDPDHGVRLKDKKKYLMIYKNAFSGSEIVDWILQNLPIRTRDEAVQLCQKILEAHFIQNAVKPTRGQFKDGKSLYQFTTIEDFHALKAKISSMREETVKVGIEDFQMLKVLGEGSTGKVFLARKKDNKKLYAIKAMDKHSLIEEGELETLLSEKTILQNDSPFLIHLHYSFQTSSHLFFAMDFIGGGDLSFHLKREEKFTEQETQFLVAELVLAIEYLHSRSVVYRDLKPENILIDSQGHICLTDFGLSKIIPNEAATMETSCGAPAYTAPEVLEGVGYTKSVDWWSLGVIMYQMLLGFTPFEFDDDFGKLIRNILTARVLYPEELVSHKAKTLLEAFLQKNPKKRLEDVDEIKHHPFFDGVDWEALAVKRVPSPFKIEMKTDDDVSNFEWKYTSQPVKEEDVLRYSSDAPLVEGFDTTNVKKG